MSLPPKTPTRRLVSTLGLGRLAYLTWHAPRSWLARSRREGGPLAQWTTRRARLAMVAAARTLPPLPAPPAAAPEVVFLTGKRFWYQTAFCLWSLRHHAGQPLNAVFYDDGSFDSALRAEALRLFPGSTVVTRDEATARLDAVLPTARFPALRHQRLTYLHLRKITDFHAGHRGWRLGLDSDMLFFRRPDALLAWLARPTQPLCMRDVVTNYGYPDPTLTTLAGRPLPTLVNVGVCGLRSDGIDWEKLEWWTARLLARHGTSYYLEQALVALLLAQDPPEILPARDYLLMPSDAECRAPTSALHHYVDLSKRGYFRHAWRHLLPRPQP